MNKLESINKEIAVGVKKAQTEISGFIEQAIKLKKNIPLELEILNHEQPTQDTNLNEMN